MNTHAAEWIWRQVLGLRMLLWRRSRGIGLNSETKSHWTYHPEPRGDSFPSESLLHRPQFAFAFMLE